MSSPSKPLFGSDRWSYNQGVKVIERQLRQPQGHDQRLPPTFYKRRPFFAAVPVGAAAGTMVFQDIPIDFEARSLSIDNGSGYELYHLDTQSMVSAGQFGFMISCQPAISQLNFMILGGSNIQANLFFIVRASEQEVTPGSGTGGPGASASGGNLGAGNWTAPAVVAVPSANSVLLVPARANRWGVDVQNRDPANDLWLAPTNAAAVGTGWPVPAGRDYPLRVQGDIWARAAVAPITVATLEIF